MNWFQWNKVEPEVGAAVDGTADEDPAMRSECAAALPGWYRFADEPDDCGEQLS